MSSYDLKLGFNCNNNCRHCVIAEKRPCGSLNENQIFELIDNLPEEVDEVQITGGEPTIHKDLKEFIKKIKDMGYKVKLDTNGYNPVMLKDLIDSNLLDYVAMDIKQTLAKYSMVSGVNINTDKIMQSIKILEDSNVLHEFRTTVIKEYHTIFDILEISDMFKKETPYYIQNFRLSSNVMNKNLHGFTEDELIYMEDVLNKKRKIKVR